jgi:hypothetical protein
LLPTLRINASVSLEVNLWSSIPSYKRVLFNQIQFVDAPSMVYLGDGNDYNQFNNIIVLANEFVPEFHNSSTPNKVKANSTFCNWQR